MKIFNKNEWKKVKLGDVCEVITGNTPLKKIEEYWNKDEVPFITPPELKYEGINYITPNIYVSKIGAKQGRIIPKNSICVCCIGSLGKLGILKEDAITNQQINSLTLKDKNVDLLYLYFYLKTIKNNLESIASSTTVKIINKSSFEKIEINLPSLEIQKKLSKKLELLENNIQLRKSQLNFLNELSKSLFRSLFLYSIKDYKEKKLEDIVEVKSSKRVFLNELSKNGIPFYRGTEIAKLSRGENVESNLFISEDLYQNLKKISDVPKIGDLLLPSICNNGEIWYVNKTNPFYFKDGRVLWLKLNKNINGKYLQYYLIEKFRQDYSKIASGTTFSELKIVTLKNLLLPVPPIELQKKFAERVEKIEKLSFEIEEAIKEAENLYNSLISKYFD